MFATAKVLMEDMFKGRLIVILAVLSLILFVFNIGIEGYTDNVPIKHSSWKSNWELSSARSLSVLYFLANEKGISPERLSAIGFGEYRPVVSNDTREGRKLNRRVEIVIQPKVSKVKEGRQLTEDEPGLLEPPGNLK